MDNANFLVVEDSPTMRQLISFSLKRFKNAKIIEAVDGVDALKKLSGPEKGTLPDDQFAFHEGEMQRLLAMLEEAAAKTALPERVDAEAKGRLNEVLLRVRGV